MTTVEQQEKRWRVIRNLFWFLIALIVTICIVTQSWYSITFIGLIFANVYVGIFAALTLGEKNMFFTLVEEGQAKGITIFKRAQKCVMAYTAHRFQGEISPKEHVHDDSYWKIVKLGKDEVRPEEKRKLHRFSRHVLGIDLGGLKWIGIWPFYGVYNYTFRWTSLRGQLPTNFTGGDGDEYEQARKEPKDYILVRQDTYLLDLKGIEDKDLIPVDIKVVWTVRIDNPFKALFRVQDWLETSSNRLMTYVRREFANSTWREFQRESYATGGKNLLDLLGGKTPDGDLNEGILEDLLKQYGVYTIGIEITELTPPMEFKEAAKKVRDAQAAEQAAEHTAQAIKILANAESYRIQQTMGAAKALGDDGVAMKIAENLAQGGKAIIAIGAASELVRDILGRKEK